MDYKPFPFHISICTPLRHWLIMQDIIGQIINGMSILEYFICILHIKLFAPHNKPTCTMVDE